MVITFKFKYSGFTIYYEEMDSTTSDSNYKQTFSSIDTGDTYVFLSFMRPLSLVELSTNSEIFVNNSPGNENKCRLLHILFAKELNELIIRIKKIEEELAQTPFTMVSIGKRLAKIKIFAHPTIMDRICLNALLEKSASQRCRGCSKNIQNFPK